MKRRKIKGEKEDVGRAEPLPFPVYGCSMWNGKSGGSTMGEICARGHQMVSLALYEANMGIARKRT